MREQPHMETLRLIRRITADGVLDMDEVYDLAHFLNECRDARKAWPGNILWETMQSIFDDGEVTEEEQQALGEILVGIAAESETIEDLGLTCYIRNQSRKDKAEG